MSLAKKIVRGSVLNLVDHAVRIAAMLAITPYMVAKLGMESYGIWLVLTAAVSFLTLLDGGITLSGTRYLARALGGSGSPASVIATLRWLYRWIGLACVTATLVLVAVVPWLVPAGTWQDTGRLVLLALGGSMAIRFFLRIHLVVLKAHLRYDLIVVASLAKIILQTVLVLTLLARGHGLVVLAVAQIVSDLVDQVLVVVFSRRTDSETSKDTVHCPELLPDILRYSAMAFLNSVGEILRSRISPFVISTYVGVASVPVYNMAVQLVTLYDDLINAALGGTLLAGFSQVEGQGGREALRSKVLLSLRFSIAMALVGAAALFVIAPAFLVLWLGAAFAGTGALLRILIVPATLKLVQYPAQSLLYTTNRHHLLTKLTFGAGIANAVLSITLASRMGIQGVVWATFIEMSLVYLIFMPKFVCSALEISAFKYAQEMLFPALRFLALLVLWGICVQPLITTDLLNLVLAGLSLVGVSAMGALWLVFTAEQRTDLYKRLRHLQ